MLTRFDRTTLGGSHEFIHDMPKFTVRDFLNNKLSLYALRNTRRAYMLYVILTQRCNPSIASSVTHTTHIMYILYVLVISYPGVLQQKYSAD